MYCCEHIQTWLLSALAVIAVCLSLLLIGCCVRCCCSYSNCNREYSNQIRSFFREEDPTELQFRRQGVTDSERISGQSDFQERIQQLFSTENDFILFFVSFLSLPVAGNEFIWEARPPTNPSASFSDISGCRWRSREWRWRQSGLSELFGALWILTHVTGAVRDRTEDFVGNVLRVFLDFV